MNNVNEIDFHRPVQRGRKAKLYMVLDCETATLPFIKEWDLTPSDKQKLSIAKPIIYDLGWRIVDRMGRVYSQHSFLIQETFFVPQVFNTAYYSWKRPLYMERFAKGEIITKTWYEAMEILLEELQYVEMSTAYNAMFDFKKAIPFTESYINALYSPHYQKWEDNQRKICKHILNAKQEGNPDFDGMHFNFRGVDYPIADLWGLACTRLINEQQYKMKCLEQSLVSQSGLYFKTSAETTFRFLVDDYTFEEEHTALNDSIIETEILCKALKKGKLEQGIEYFPFKELGETTDFITRECKVEKLSVEMIQNVISIMEDKLDSYMEYNPFAEQLTTKMLRLTGFLEKNFGVIQHDTVLKCEFYKKTTRLAKQKNYIGKLKEGGNAYLRVAKEIAELEEWLKENARE